MRQHDWILASTATSVADAAWFARLAAPDWLPSASAYYPTAFQFSPSRSAGAKSAQACPEFRRGEIRAETWCALADDQPQAEKNCDGAKHRRWRARTESGDCPKHLWPAAPPPREPCPSCDIPVPPIRTLDDVHAAVRDILAGDLQPPAFKDQMGIVTAGEGRYEAGIVIGIKLLRDVLKCDLPLTVFHRGEWKTCLRGYDVNLVSSDALQAAHPARNYGGWQSKSYAVVHSGYKRCLWLDADAYCIRDPRPLFSLLDDHGYVGWKDYGPGAGCGPEMKLPYHFNGGVYLVNLETHWNQMVATRFLDNYGWCSYAAVHPAFIRHGLGDECSTRLVRHLSDDRGYYGAEWCGRGRTKGVGFLAYWRDVPYLAHRMRKESKLFLGTVPRSNLKWPHESTVLRLFEELSPEYQAQKAAAIYARSAQGLREARRKILQSKGKRCPRTSRTACTGTSPIIWHACGLARSPPAQRTMADDSRLGFHAATAAMPRDRGSHMEQQTGKERAGMVVGISRPAI